MVDQALCEGIEIHSFYHRVISIANIANNFIMYNKKNSKSTVKLPRLPASQRGSPEKMKRRPSREQETSNELTATAYGLYDEGLRPVVEFNSKEKREIASLTKIMTMYCTIRLCQKLKIDHNKCFFRVTVNAAGLRGTSAELQSREWATIQDLLHGLMLPSGNDAATVLAQNLGACLYYERLGESHLLVDLKSLDLTDDTWNLKIYIEQFVKYMNQTAKEIGMKESHYANPHGLDCSFRLQAYSTVEDQALLAKVVSSESECAKIMGTISHTGELKSVFGKEVEVRKKTWKNTHVLLSEQGFMGGKTGQTQYAGNCLVSYFQSKSSQKYFIVVLGCGSKELRFAQTKILIEKYT